MRFLTHSIHPSIDDISTKSVYKRLSTRAIVIDHHDILLLYTERYQDYSLPGGGLEPEEDQIEGMIRELQEETGAQNIRNIQPFGIYEEHRPWHKPEHDLVHMISYCYSCNADKELGSTNYEQYEHDNGMKPIWVNIHEAIKHNEHTLAHSEKKGMSIEREIYLLKRIVNDLLI